METRIICDQLFHCGEGPCWDPESGFLYWTDSGGNVVYSYSEEKGCMQIHKGIRAASLTLHAHGGLMCCGENGFFRLLNDGSVRMIATNCAEEPLTNINDIIADPLGRVFGGQEQYSESLCYKTGFLYRVDIDGTVTAVEEGLHIANGMGLSPDLKTFYLTDTIERKIYSYDYNLASGSISNKKCLIKLNSDQGLPDGLTIDRDGFIWTARWFGYGLSRYDPDGKLERNIELPFAQPTSLTFGGIDYNEIFITSASIEWVSRFAPNNHDYRLFRGGPVYSIKQDIQGKPEFVARV